MRKEDKYRNFDVTQTARRIFGEEIVEAAEIIPEMDLSDSARDNPESNRISLLAGVLEVRFTNGHVVEMSCSEWGSVALVDCTRWHRQEEEGD